MSSHRLLRVQELLKRLIGEALRREIPVEKAGLLTINDVEVSPDLRQANAYVGFLGSSEQKREALKLLQKCRSRIQAHVAQGVVMKFTPHIRFVADESVERGNRVLEIINELENPPSSS